MAVSSRVQCVSRRFTIRAASVLQCLLLVVLLVPQQQALARVKSGPVHFMAVSLPLEETASGMESPALVETAEFAAFLPMPGIDMLRKDIAERENAGDYFSPTIAEQSVELGKALQAEGKHEAALQAFDRSLEILRRHEGLHSPRQSAILLAKVESQLALGAMDAGDELQQARYLMQQKYLAGDDIGLAEAHTSWADWNMKYYLQAWENPMPGGVTTAQAEALARRMALALGQYHMALELLSRQAPEKLYREKVALEQKIAALALMADRQHQRNMPSMLTKTGQSSFTQTRLSHNPLLFEHGSSAMERALEYGMATADPGEIAERLLELADWYLLMDKHEEARSSYNHASALLQEAGFADARITAILESGLPVHDPQDAFAHFSDNGMPESFDGYYDVAFDLNRFGKASNPRVLDASMHDRQVEKALFKRIRQSRYRPLPDAGATRDKQLVMVRYYFSR